MKTLTTALLTAAALATALPCAAAAQAAAGTAAWDSVGRVLQSPPVSTGGYHRYNFPRKDITLHVGDVTVSPMLALGSWAGFGGTPADAMMMGDLVLKGEEVKPVLAELARQHLDVTAIHNHLVGEEPRLIYLHYHGQGRALDLAQRLDHVLAQTATPRPVAAGTPAAVTIDTAMVFRELGASGKANGAVAQLGFNFVPGRVTMHGRAVVPALGYGSPINVQMVDASHAVATGDFAVPATRVGPLLEALAAHGITATALHTHMVGEQPTVYFIHFWADGGTSDVLAGLKAAITAAR